ncbi:MAG: zf-TFIIB domain-containing protein [Sedimentisphaerales bacterium]|nr:zf-TFIIB domain-containing protein [Sedimentisphaerales bacterium]
MDCPVCKQIAMVTLELNEVEIDYCIQCEGIWLDAGELELLLGEPKKAKELLNSFKADTGVTEKIRKCPICYKKMQKIVVGSVAPKLLIDRCIKGDGLWFDKGELHNIFENAQLDENNKIKALLTDMFNHKSVQ